MADLESDIQEVKSMLEQAKRPNVRTELERVLLKLEDELKAAKPAATAKEPAATSSPSSATPKPVETPHKPVDVQVKSAGPWTEVTTFALDLGGYDKPNVCVDLRLKGVEALTSEAVTCDFTSESFDLKVVGLDGVNYRFKKTNLEKDIVPSESNVRVKKNHVIIQMAKVKGQYGYDSWHDLLAKGKRKTNEQKKSDSANPQDSIMNMMKDMYDDGDESMKKVIGEAMYKAQRGEKLDKDQMAEGLQKPSAPADGGLEALVSSGLDDM